MNKVQKIGVGIAGGILAAAAIGCAAFFILFPPVRTVQAADPATDTDRSGLRIASYNTAAPWGNALLGTGSSRRVKLFSNELVELAPDSIGVQEINSAWVQALETSAPEYAYYGVPRGGDRNEKESEMSGIFYRKDRYDLLESHTFWISDTPDQMSKYPDAGCYRICSYVVLKDRATGFTYAHLNTHLDNVSTAAQNLGGVLIAQRAQTLRDQYGEGLAVVLTGDFNQYADGAACTALIEAGYQNASAADPQAAHTPTYHNWGRITQGQPIDFIFYAGGIQPEGETVHTQKSDRAYTSDHYCISADFIGNE